MSKTRSKKEEELSVLTDRLQRMKSVVMSTYTGLKVTDATKIRKKLREEGVDYMVAKKTLLARACTAAGIAFPDLSSIRNGVALAFSYGDEVAPAKIIDGFRKEHEVITFLGGVVGGAVYDGAQIQSLAKLPSRQELIAKMLGSLTSPLSGFLRVASGPTSGFVRVLQGRAEQSS